jgi:glycerol-3-phosphate dehydrogenase
VEKTALAAGTSSRSSKLIHGGLRYLETYQFGVVRECLQERRILLRIAPELVHLEPFHLPLYEDAKRRPGVITTGLCLYALLARFGPGSTFSRLSAAEVDRFPGLRREGLRCIFRFHDARTDDRQLTRAVMTSALDLGARLWQKAECLQLRLGTDGAVADVLHRGQQREVHCRVVVNAAGPWVGQVLERVTPELDRPNFDLVQGAHIVFPEPIVDRCYYLENPRDGRGVFALPWQGGTLVGTTETHFRGDPDNVAPRKSEIRYLRRAVGHYFPDSLATAAGSIRGFAGLRVLPVGSQHAFRRSRETTFAVDRAADPRIISILGGKLTAYRATALKVMHRIGGRLAERRALADTAELPLRPPADDLPDV